MVGRWKISFAHFTWKYLFVPVLPRKGQQQFSQFSLCEWDSVFVISSSTGILSFTDSGTWFLFFFYFSESHIYSSLLWQLRELQAWRIWWRAAFHFSSLRVWSKHIVCNTVWIKPKESSFPGSVKRASSLQTSVLLSLVRADGIGSCCPFTEDRPNAPLSQ